MLAVAWRGHESSSHTCSSQLQTQSREHQTKQGLKAHANGCNIVGQQHPTLLNPAVLWLVVSIQKLLKIHQKLIKNIENVSILFKLSISMEKTWNKNSF